MENVTQHSSNLSSEPLYFLIRRGAKLVDVLAFAAEQQPREDYEPETSEPTRETVPPPSQRDTTPAPAPSTIPAR